MVITMLKSVIDSVPIVFVLIGQQQVGTIDFQLRPTLGIYVIPEEEPVLADRNHYNDNPFIEYIEEHG